MTPNGQTIESIKIPEKKLPPVECHIRVKITDERNKLKYVDVEDEKIVSVAHIQKGMMTTFVRRHRTSVISF